MAELKVKEIAEAASAFLAIPFSEIWSHYDREADVLYLNFKKPSARTIASSPMMMGSSAMRRAKWSA
jgi:hypothetical protein